MDGRTLTALAVISAGVLVAVVIASSGASPGTVLVPVSLAVVMALAILPFPAADYAFALGLLGTFPLFPPSGLPNLPLAAAVIGVALMRVIGSERSLPPMRLAVAVTGVWALVVVGALISHWPPVGVWLRPAGVLAVGLAAALLGLVVWRDAARRWRWIVALVAATLVVSISGLVIFGLQYVAPAQGLVDAVVGTLGYLRGDAAAVAFDAVNNWIIAGEPRILRALSPLFPSPLSLGAYLGIGIPLAAALALNHSASRLARMLAFATLGLSGVALIVTYSRSSWVASLVAGVAVAVVALFGRWRSRSPTRSNEEGRSDSAPRRRAVVAFSVTLVVASVVGLAGILTTANERAWERIAAATEDHSVVERIEGGGAAVERIQAGLLRGTGLGNWTGTADAQPREPGQHARYVHNIYLEYASATGVLGGLWVVLVFALTIAGGVTAAVRGSTIGTVMSGLALVAIGTFAAAQGFFDDTFLNPQIAWLVAWSFGGGVAMLRVPAGSSPTTNP